MQDSFVSDPNTLVQNGQTVKVHVTGWDPAKNRLALSMKADPASNGASAGRSAGGDGQPGRQPRQGKVATAGMWLSPASKLFCSELYLQSALLHTHVMEACIFLRPFTFFQLLRSGWRKRLSWQVQHLHLCPSVSLYQVKMFLSHSCTRQLSTVKQEGISTGCYR